MKTKSLTEAEIAAYQRLMDQFTQLTDRANFVRQRCSGLGRMECQTLQLLELYRQRKPDLRKRIAQRLLSEEEVTLYIPRCMRNAYHDGALRKDQLEQLPRDLSMKALADEIGVACSRMTRIGDTLSDERDPGSGQMRGKGLIHREPSSDDRRVILIRITDEGSARVRDQKGHAGRITRMLLDQIPKEQRESVRQGLEIYLGALERILPAVLEAAGPLDCDTN
jgi:DNA-binding MarR family transcriptional regulator